MKNIDQIVDSYKTYCCNVSFKQISKMMYKCSKCDNDVTYDFFLTVKSQVD
jgi:hypothetical protein